MNELTLYAAFISCGFIGSCGGVLIGHWYGLKYGQISTQKRAAAEIRAFMQWLEWEDRVRFTSKMEEFLKEIEKEGRS